MQAARPLTLTEPSLVVLIGAAGSGKSTLAARLFPAKAILSSDTYRALVSGSEADQRATKAAFAILDRELERRLAAGRTAVVDATSVTRFARMGLLRRAVAHRIPAVAIVLDLDPEVVLARNTGRAGRVVPDVAVKRQLADLARSLEPGVLGAEGFEAVYVVRTPAELDALEVDWRR
ncbi:MAG: AAA family ATPase [Candidatus Limnocylindrales bacterium]